MENTNATPTPAVATDLNPQQALSILVQAVRFAQGKGAFSLEDAETIMKAVRVFVKPEDTPAAASVDAPVKEEATAPVN